MPGPDIFLSYNREDSGRAKLFAEAFAAEGFDVWWDVALRSGEAYDEVTEAALGNARAVVVLWSPRSVVSRWVRAEATEAERNKTLLPAMIEACKRPIMFELVQTAELSHWQGDTGDAAWLAFLGDVRKFVGEKGSPTAAPQTLSKAPAGLSVVVLPFANMSADPEQEYFADGISEDIITDLSKVSALLVIARNTAFTFKGKHVDVAQVARQLGVSHVLEGSVRKAGHRIRVTAQLIDGATGGHVWADRYDRDLDDIFELQDELSEAIVGALKLKLLPRERKAIEDRGTDNPEAYRHYKRARAMRASHSAAGMDAVIGAYDDALALDPAFAKAWAGLSTAVMHLLIFFPHVETDEARRAQMDEAYARAKALAPEDPDVVACRSTLALLDYDWAEVENCAVLWGNITGEAWTIHGHTLLALGRAGQAVEAQREVHRQDPLSIGAAAVLQFNLDCAGRMDEADAEYHAAKTLPGGKDYLEWVAAMRLMAMGDHARFAERFRAYFSGGTKFHPWTATMCTLLDRPEEALELVRSLHANSALTPSSSVEGIAGFATYFGDLDTALAALRRGVVDQRGFNIQVLWHPMLAPLRRDARFKQIVIDSGLADHWRKTGNWGDFARPVGDDDFELIA